MSFERSLARLEAIVRELEQNDIELEQALKLFEEGIGHIRTANEALVSVEARVQQQRREQIIKQANEALTETEVDELEDYGRVI